MNTLQGLLDAKLAQRASERSAELIWRAGQSGREAEACEAFEKWLAETEGVELSDDCFLSAAELYLPSIDAAFRTYRITLALCAINACIEVTVNWINGAVSKGRDQSWLARTVDNSQGLDTLTDALMWLTDDGKIRLDAGIPVKIPMMQEA